jgi:hypothetical protein
VGPCEELLQEWQGPPTFGRFAGFLDEASLAVGIGHGLGTQNLEGHRPAQAGVPGAEQHAQLSYHPRP